MSAYTLAWLAAPVGTALFVAAVRLAVRLNRPKDRRTR